MKPTYAIICLLLFALTSGCINNMQDDLSVKTEKDSSYYFYNLAVNEDITRTKIQYLNQALSKLQNKKDSLHPRLLDYKIYYHNRLKEFDSALFFADSLERLAPYQKDTRWIALAFYRKAVINRYLDNQEAVFKYAFEARQRHLQTGDSTEAARRTLEMAIAQSRMQDFIGSQETATEALRYLKEEDSRFLSSAYNIIGLTYWNQDFYKDALKEYQNALRYSEDLGDSLSYQNNIGLVYRDQKEYKKAISLFEDLNRVVSKNDYTARARYLDNLAFTKWLQDTTVNVSSELNHALQLRKDNNDSTGLNASYRHLSEFYKNRNKTKAIDYAEKWLKTGEANNSLQVQIDALERLMILNPGETNYVSEYVRLNDSLNKVNLRAKYTFAKIRFDEERKQQQISSLEASAAIQALENQEIKTRNYILVFFAVLVISLAAFIIYSNRQKHKREKIREIHNTEVRISKKIHDELANDVYNVMTTLEKPDGFRKEETLNRLESIYSRTRNISRENTPVDTGPNFQEDLQYMLSHSTPSNARLFLTGFQDISWQKINHEAKIIIYRSLQELMVNMNKHSKASIIGLNFRQTGSKLQITYNDDGVGISSEEVKKGSGLKNVENRIVSIGGVFNFQPGKEKGFSANILIPV